MINNFPEKFVQLNQPVYCTTPPSNALRTSHKLSHCVPTPGAASQTLRTYQIKKVHQLVRTADGRAAQQKQISTSPWSWTAPCLIRNTKKKKGGGQRRCIDCRCLRGLTTPERTAPPEVDTLLGTFGSVKYFARLDLRQGRHQPLVAPGNRKS